MPSKKKWLIAGLITALMLIFIAVMLIAGEQLSLENKLSIIIVAAVMSYFIYLASSMRK